MTQQTIGNTGYTVGQVLKNYTEAAPLLDYIHEARWDGEFFESELTAKSYNILNLNAQDFPITITALPNPDVVADEWREVVLMPVGEVFAVSHMGECDWKVETERHALQLAMHEVCKADEVSWGITDCGLGLQDSFTAKKPLTLSQIQDIALCFLLGGKVSVKGGV